MDSSIKALHKNIAEWLAGPTGSVFLHVALILALLFFVDLSTKKKIDLEYEVRYLDPQELTLDLPPPELTPPEDLDMSVVPTVVPPDLSADMAFEPLSEDFTPEAVAVTPPILEIPPFQSPLLLKGIAAGPLHNRVGAEAHAAAGQQHGGAHWMAAEAAVKRALEWLRVNQNADGSWGASDREALAGLGILTFLAHGETTASAEYGETVKRAIQYLVARQGESGGFAKVDTTAGTYAQAICVYALSEAYGMTRIPALKSVMERGVQVLIDGQQARGGFDYRFAQGARRDTSLGGWCSQALKAAFIAGAGNPGLKPAMDLAVADMKAAQKADGSFYYTDRGSHSTHSMTAVAVLSLQLLGQGGTAEARRGLAALGDARCDWRDPPAWPMYAWYYVAQSKFHRGGAHWRSWNNQFAPQFIRNQNPDGSWNSAGLVRGAGTTGRENLHPAYATTLAALTLQVYYRFLPTYQPIEQQAVDQHDPGDVRIQIL
jgi:hypothetical protein